MKNLMTEETTIKKGNSGLAWTGCALFVIGYLAILISSNFMNPKAIVSGNIYLLGLLAFIVGIIFLCIWSPLRGRRLLWNFLLMNMAGMTFLSVFIAVNQANPSFMKSMIVQGIELLLWILIVGAMLFLGYFFARKWQVIPAFSIRHLSWQPVLIGFFLLIASQIIIASIFTSLGQGSISANQKLLNQSALQVPFLAYYLTTIVAGFFEELMFRVGSFEILLPKHKNWAALVSVLAFTLAHGPNNLQALLTYGTMAIILTVFYYKYRNFYLNMSIHMSLNLLAGALFFFSTVMH